MLYSPGAPIASLVPPDSPSGYCSSDHVGAGLVPVSFQKSASLPLRAGMCCVCLVLVREQQVGRPGAAARDHRCGGPRKPAGAVQRGTSGSLAWPMLAAEARALLSPPRTGAEGAGPAS